MSAVDHDNLIMDGAIGRTGPICGSRRVKAPRDLACFCNNIGTT